MDKDVLLKMVRLSKEVREFNRETLYMVQEYKRKIEILIKRKEKREMRLFVCKVSIVIATAIFSLLFCWFLSNKY